MDDFLEEFFPAVYEKKHRAKENNYCKYDNQHLQLFTSSLYLAAIVASFMASLLCKRFGRKITIQLASVLFVAGSVLNTIAPSLNMLIAGRICLGAGVGFGNLVCPFNSLCINQYRSFLKKYVYQLSCSFFVCVSLVATYNSLPTRFINYVEMKLVANSFMSCISLSCSGFYFRVDLYIVDIREFKALLFNVH